MEYFPKQCYKCNQRLGKLRCNVGEIKCIGCSKYFCESCYENHRPIYGKCKKCNYDGYYRCNGDFSSVNLCNYCD